MASPTIRGVVAPVAGGATTSPSGTAIGDLVVVFTFERLGAGSASTLTIDTGNGYSQINNQFHNDSSTDGAFAVGYKVATASGAQSYQAFTSTTGTPNWATGCVVFQVSTFDITDIKSAFVSQSTNAVPDPPSVTLGNTRDWVVLAISAWHISSATVTPTAPSSYINLAHISGSDDIELAVSTRALTAAASENPGTYGDNVAPSGTCSFSVGISNPLPRTITATAPVITLSAPAASLSLATTLVATAPVITVTAPAAGIQQASDATLTATAPTLTITAPAASRLAETSVVAGAPTVLLTAPGTTLSIATILTATAPTVTLTAPTTDLLSEGGEQFLVATAPTITFSVPVATFLRESTLVATTPVITLTAPVAALVPGNSTIVATAPTMFLTSAGATILLESSVPDGGFGFGGFGLTGTATLVPYYNWTGFWGI